jgi:hypothetical protein
VAEITHADDPSDPARIEARPDLPQILLAGACRITLVSRTSGTRYTYRIAAPRDDARGRKAAGPRPCWKCKGTGDTRWGRCYACQGTGETAADPQAGVRFVSTLTGSDNESDYSYTGCVRGVGSPRPVYSHGGAKARIGSDAPSARGIDWLLGRVLSGASVADQCEIWHASSCARCGRALTDPESIQRRYGPECWEIATGG